MSSMNNWLGFSLSPHEELPAAQPHTSTSIIAGDEVSAGCYGSFGILEDLHQPNHHLQDWGSKTSLEQYKGSTSELSMLVGSSGGGDRSAMDEDQPKLEDFLGGHSFSGHDQKLSSMTEAYDNHGGYMYSNNENNGGGNSGGSMGLSMIKSWLRNQPAQHHPHQGAPSPQGDGGSGLSDVGGGAIVAASSQSLSLSMSTGSLAAAPAASGGGESLSSSANKQNAISAGGCGLDAQSGAIEAAPRKSIDTFGQRTSIYRGVTRHRWTGRYEAHLWDNSCRREGQTRKGRQVYLGGYDKEDKAARSYDLAALKYWGTTTTTNFPISNYEKELEDMKHMTRQEYIASLRRKSSGFSRGASIYRGVTRHHQHGRWQARIGRVAGNKDLYLGTFSTQEEAAEAYDIAAIKFRGLNAVTNFDMNRYDVKSILESSTLPVGGAAKRLKDVSDGEASVGGRRANEDSMNPQLADAINGYGASHHGWPPYAFQQAHPLGIHYSHAQPRGWCKQEQDAVVVAAQNLQDLQQLQLGSITHNFFHPPGIHNMMSLESSPSLEHSTGSNSAIYNRGVGVNGVGYQVGNGGSDSYMIPMSTMVADQGPIGQATSSYGDNDQGKQLVYDGMISNGDPYGDSRNMYYLSQQISASDAGVKECDYEQGGGCNNWMPAPVQAIEPRGNHGTPLFTVWNDA